MQFSSGSVRESERVLLLCLNYAAHPQITQFLRSSNRSQTTVRQEHTIAPQDASQTAAEVQSLRIHVLLEAICSFLSSIHHPDCTAGKYSAVARATSCTCECYKVANIMIGFSFLCWFFLSSLTFIFLFFLVSACATGTWSADVKKTTACSTAWKMCSVGQYQTSAPSASTDRVCAACQSGMSIWEST